MMRESGDRGRSRLPRTGKDSLRVEPLSSERVAEIRDALPGDISYRDVQALCDTVESLRADLDVKLKALERLARDFAVLSGSGGALLSTIRELEEAEAELETLRQQNDRIVTENDRLIRELSDAREAEGVVAQQESAPGTPGTSAGSNPAHPHPSADNEVGQPELSPRRFQCSECDFDSDEDHMVRVERQRWVCDDCVSNLLDEIERLNRVTGDLREYADRLDDPMTRGIGARLREIANRTAEESDDD